MSSSPPANADTSTPHIRASGRVRKQPDAYASTSFSGSKRKRSRQVGDGDGDLGIPDGYLSDEEDEEDDEDDEDEEDPDEEEVREQKKKARRPKASTAKKPAAKKPRMNGASLPIRSVSGNKRKRAPRRPNGVDIAGAEAAGGLYAEVFASGQRPDDIAADWLTRFGQYESQALAEVVNFVLKATGCSGTVTPDDIEDPDGVTSKLDDLRDEHQATNPTDYPLIAKGKAAAAVREGLSGFLHAVVRSMAATNVLYGNPGLIENMQVWFSTMSSAPNRAFRHTATVVSLSIVTALCEVARENAQEMARDQRQAETERKKPRANKARVLQIEEKVTGKGVVQEFVEALLKDWFDTVFIHRYRDVDPAIRRDCTAALGDWITTMPEVFFDSNHLRYMGWVLSDTVPATRVEVVKQLLRFYTDQNMLGGLKTFTEKFRSRLVELATTDAETSVRASGLELLDRLRENGLLEPDDIDAVGRLIFDTDPRVRKAVANFFAEIVNDLYSSKTDDLGGLDALQDALPEVGEGNYDAPRLEWLKFKSLAEMLQTYDTDDGLPSQIERSRGDGGLNLHLGNSSSRYMVAAETLYDKIDEIGEWQMLAGYLLFDHFPRRSRGAAHNSLAQLKHECVLTEKEERILLEVLNASVKRTLTDLAEKSTAPKGKLTKKQKDDLREEQMEAARHLTHLFPKLLKKFGDAPSTAAAVLRIEGVLNLPSLSVLRQDNGGYAAILDDIGKQFMSHGTDVVLGPASDAILHAKSYGELEDLTDEKVNGLWEDVIGNLSELVDPPTLPVRAASSSEALVALSNNLLRIMRLASVSNCIPHLEDGSLISRSGAGGAEYQGAIDYIIALIRRAVPATGPQPDKEDASLEDEIAARAAEAALFYTRWRLKSIIEAITAKAGAGFPDDDLQALAVRRDDFVDGLKAVLLVRRPADEISGVVAGCMLDLYWSAAILQKVQPQPGVSDHYTVLVMDLDPDVQTLILRVFAAAERNFARLSKRKLGHAPATELDVALDADPVDEDPLSDAEPDGGAAASTASPAPGSPPRGEARLLATLLAEQKLCALTGKLVQALVAGVMAPAPTRARLERHRAKLGPNYKECLAFLDFAPGGSKSGGARSKGKRPATTTTTTTAAATNDASASAPHPKSHAIVAADELEDEIEDEAEEEEEEARRNRELIPDDEPEPELEPEAEETAAPTAAVDEDEESMEGD